MRLLHRALLSVATALCAAVAVSPLSAQTAYPTKPITLLVPTAAGGPTDTVARLIAESMGKSLGQTVVIENVSGAGGTIGMGRVARAAPDGYTIAIWHVAHATAPALYAGLKYDPVADFDQIGRITDVPMTLVTKTAVPAKDVTELIAWLRKENTNVTYGHAGIGSASHLCTLILSQTLGVELRGIAYRGTGPAMNDLIGGQFDFMCDQTTNTTNQIKDGKIRGYAVTTKQRVSSLPDLPTLDSGPIKGFEVTAWHAMWAPKGLPREVTDKLVAALQTALKDAKVIERFAALGTEPVPPSQTTPDALRAQLSAEVQRWDTAIKKAGVKGE
ncbi:tripartite tricarboxylate transporter substrate-binding protein [uncultured Alsobacter sp.]|uniref:tripartite tricarboxylate transporter substrate-binding protein n=1 Tax=uncultured Alsobacter sp. TaxID=1748258 RepID=UPI0025F27AF1|nr:tripartite tricarboxylate transporter substrate-binding protein [uncultured Alsobacter sp.]